MIEDYENININPYSIINYDKVFILLKPEAQTIKSYPDKIHFDNIKKRYYLSGRIIQLSITNKLKQVVNKYPLRDMISFIDERDISAFKRSKKDYFKEGYIINVGYGDIDFITLDFNSFDWK